MNAHLAKFLMYYEIHRLYREDNSVRRITELLGLNRRTIGKYLSMSEKEYETYLLKGSDRKKELQSFEVFVKERLQLYPDTSAAQMHDWLKEHHMDFPELNAKTIFNFVHWVRTKYNIPKRPEQRQHSVVEELPFYTTLQLVVSVGILCLLLFSVLRNCHLTDGKKDGTQRIRKPGVRGEPYGKSP